MNSFAERIVRTRRNRRPALVAIDTEELNRRGSHHQINRNENRDQYFEHDENNHSKESYETSEKDDFTIAAKTLDHRPQMICFPMLAAEEHATLFSGSLFPNSLWCFHFSPDLFLPPVDTHLPNNFHRDTSFMDTIVWLPENVFDALYDYLRIQEKLWNINALGYLAKIEDDVDDGNRCMGEDIRAKIVNAIIKIATRIRIPRAAIYLAVDIFDRYLNLFSDHSAISTINSTTHARNSGKEPSLDLSKLLHIGSTCLWVRE